MKWLLLALFGMLGLPSLALAQSSVYGTLDATIPAITLHEGAAEVLSEHTVFVSNGTDELRISGAERGSTPTLTVTNLTTGSATTFDAYGAGYTGGVRVAACDVTGDGTPEIITGTGQGGGPHVRVFDLGGTVIGSFFAYAEGFRGGVNVACGDLDGDDVAEIVTAPGIGGSAHVRVFNEIGVLKDELILDSALDDSGAAIKVGNVTDLADHNEIIAHKLKTGNSDVLVLTLSPNLSVYSSFTVPVENTSLRVSLLDVTGDNIEEIVTLPRNLPLNRIDFHNDSGAVVATSPLSAPITGTADLLKTSTDSATILHDAQDLGDRGAQRIVVDISEQRLTAYENDIAVHTFLISSGTYSFPTPLGSTTVTAKLPVHRYTWSYGPNNPNNYDLPGVKWNLRFRTNYYIHSAYWHNNFGRRMSHGCINVDMKNAEWIYNWAEVGAVVDIIP